MKQYRLWIVVWLVLNIIDGIVTALILSRGGYELNPFSSTWGLIGFTAIKTGAMIFAVLGLYFIKRLEWLPSCCVGLVILVIYTARWLVL